MLEKSENTPWKRRERYFVCLVWLMTAVISSCACAFASRAVVLDPCETTGEVGESEAVEPSTVERVCGLIYQGEFASAGQLIAKSGGDEHPRARFLSELAEIVREYEDISKRRQSAREAAYKEQLAELEKFRNGADANGAPATGAGANRGGDANDVDPNDANDVSLVLSVVARVREFADDARKERLLDDEFVKQTIQRAVDRAAGFETEGKWLEAYTSCYYWLEVIDPNNEAYSDYAEQLLEKAQIAASFEDSPCETSKERYEGIKKEMFVRAIHALSVNYVSLIDYGEMATKAVNRCKLLAEVMGKRAEFVVRCSLLSVDSKKESDEGEKGSEFIVHSSFSPADKQKLTAWLVALAAVEDEMKDAPTGFNKGNFMEVFDRVLTLNTSIAELPEPVLIAQFSEAALSALDPYTVMVWPKQVQDFEKMMTNEFTGIGIEISKRQGLLTVASLLPDTPAYNSGLDAGDVIEKVNGVETKDMTLICAVHKITGPKGTEVLLTIKRPGEEKTKDITITRDRIKVPTIRGWRRTEAGKWLHIVDEKNKIGYVRLTSFSGQSASGLENILLELESEGLEGLILDLRFNTGGLLESAVAVADKFLDGGLIVKTQPGPGFGKWPSYSTAHKSKTHPNYPLVILMNSSSASASEIVSGALADEGHKRAILVGARTHGKGSVQGITHYPGGGAQLKYTMAYYHLPSSQRVESRDAMEKQGRTDWGIGPNVEVKLRSDELKEMIDTQRDNDVLVQAGRNGVGPELKKHTIKETLAADPQLAVGFLVVKSKLIQARASAAAEQN
ncbi:MAG: S41 family peptidase [Planctomycetes bacterium]|nr:S41 family peptidase [Planctomycetota bacterium]